jgi:hypothetical protein
MLPELEQEEMYYLNIKNETDELKSLNYLKNLGKMERSFSGSYKASSSLFYRSYLENNLCTHCCLGVAAEIAQEIRRLEKCRIYL